MFRVRMFVDSLLKKIGLKKVKNVTIVGGQKVEDKPITPSQLNNIHTGPDYITVPLSEISERHDDPSKGIDLRKYSYVQGKTIKITLNSLMVLLASLADKTHMVEMLALSDNRILMCMFDSHSRGNLVYDLTANEATCISNGWIFFLESEFDRARVREHQKHIQHSVYDDFGEFV